MKTPEEIVLSLEPELDKIVRANLDRIAKRNKEMGIKVTLDFNEHREYLRSSLVWPLISKAAELGSEEGLRQTFKCPDCGGNLKHANILGVWCWVCPMSEIFLINVKQGKAFLSENLPLIHEPAPERCPCGGHYIYPDSLWPSRKKCDNCGIYSEPNQKSAKEKGNCKECVWFEECNSGVDGGQFPCGLHPEHKETKS